MTTPAKLIACDACPARRSTLPFDMADMIAVRLLPAQFARMVGVSKQSVSKWIRAGKVTLGPDGRLDPVAEHLELIAALAAHGRLDIGSPVEMREALWVMMTKVPAISSAGFATLDLKLDRVVRRPDGQVVRDTTSLVDTPRGLKRFHELQTSHRTFWGAPFWSETQRQLVLNVRTPVRRLDDAFIGGLLATVAVCDLSYLIGEGRTGGGTVLKVPINLGVGALLLAAGHLDLAGDKYSEHLNNLGNGFIGSYVAATGFAFGKRWRETGKVFGGGGHPFTQPYENGWPQQAEGGAPSVRGDLTDDQMASIVQRMQQAAAAPAYP